MIDSRAARLGALSLLLVALAIVFVAFGTLTSNPDAGRYPGIEDIQQDADRYAGDRVVIQGTAVETNPLVIEEPYTLVKDGTIVRGTTTFTVSTVEEQVQRGDSVQVFGTLTAARHVRATSTVVVPPENFRIMYAISFLAGLWVLVRIVRQWSFDWRRFSLEPRTVPLGSDFVGSVWGARTEEDENA